MKENRIICISREFGSGGHELGEHLSEKLGIKLFDSEIITKVAELGNVPEDFVEEQGEARDFRGFLGGDAGWTCCNGHYKGFCSHFGEAVCPSVHCHPADGKRRRLLYFCGTMRGCYPAESGRVHLSFCPQSARRQDSENYGTAADHRKGSRETDQED